MRLFVLSTSYIENTLVNLWDYLLNTDITQIALLRENHSPIEYADGQCPRVVLYPNIREAVQNSDVAVTINCDNVLDKCVVDNCRAVSGLHSVNFYEIGIGSMDCGEQASRSYDVPVVLLASIGKYVQEPIYELALNQLFSQNKVNFMQEFSPLTGAIIQGLDKAHLLRAGILFHNGKAPDVIIKAIDANGVFDTHHDSALLANMLNIRPDFTMLLCENCAFDWERIRNIFYYRYSTRIDNIFQSDYRTVYLTKDRVPIMNRSTCSAYADLMSVIGSGALWDAITRTVAYPPGIERLN